MVKKDEFKIGERIVYVEVDSIMPERPEFEFLRDRKFRVKTIKLRKQISQGLVLPLSVLPAGTSTELDADVTDALGIIKHDPEAEQERRLLLAKGEKQKPHGKMFGFMMRFGWFRRLFAPKPRKKGFPAWIVKSDEVRIQNKTAMFEIEQAQETKFTVTEKIDGQSATYFLNRVGLMRKFEFGVCSRNIRLGKPDGSSYWSVAAKYDIENVLRSLIGKADRIVLQGEIIGPGIQGNKYRVGDYDFYAFNLIYPDKKIDTVKMKRVLLAHNIKTVPILQTDMPLLETISDMVDFSKGKSTLLPSQKREGIVMRNYARNISFKVINPEFLLSEEG